jgi:LmbE family N-acetylglucosaminyl deacetylase
LAHRSGRVLVVVAHPDDAEAAAGGTVAKFIHEGAQVTFCVVTNGDKGSGDRTMTPERLATLRREEQRNAARVLGVEVVEFLGFPDCEVENTRESRMAVTAAIRRHRPDLILTQNPERTKRLGVSHRDHRIVGGIALDCVYPLARDHMAFPELLAQGLEPHMVTEVHLMAWEHPDLVVDISETIDLKIAALACHASQMPDRIALEKSVRERHVRFGQVQGYPYAEMFTRVT